MYRQFTTERLSNSYAGIVIAKMVNALRSTQMNLSTSFSDMILTASCLLAIHRLHNASNNWHLHLLVGTVPVHETPFMGIAGFSLIALASFLGVLRFGFSEPPAPLVKYHQMASWFAGLMGISLLAVDINFLYRKMTGWLHLLDASVILLSRRFLPAHLLAILEQLQQAVVVISIVLVSFLHQNWNGVLGAQMVALAGISIGTEGTVFRMPAVDAFHYTMACAVYLLSRALSEIL